MKHSFENHAETMYVYILLYYLKCVSIDGFQKTDSLIVSIIIFIFNVLLSIRLVRPYTICFNNAIVSFICVPKKWLLLYT